jgi:hypothetical protein
MPTYNIAEFKAHVATLVNRALAKKSLWRGATGQS